MSHETSSTTDGRELIAAFTVTGEPVSKARARFTNYGSMVRAYTPQRVKDAEQGIAWAFRAAGGRFEPDKEVTFAVEATFHNATRQRRDVDNMLKLVLDGLNGIAWVDDTQVVDILGRKRFVGEKDEACTEVAVYRVGHLERITAPCLNCGQRFATYRSLKDRVKFCSKECREAYRIARRQRVCEQCGADFLAHGPTNRTRFCSRECKAANARTVIDCKVCGTAFEQYKSWVEARPYCSQECVKENARIAAKLRRSKTFPGTCSICGAGTTRKEYRRCNPCKLSGKQAPN